ncbi:MAG: hypothetical protein EON91_00755 [Brevundimonas sp.]|uniref:hypothetical protein n=1 Tax=Brevundimonas sp. TaxID=1871086 RepID=UPI00121C37CC|nr:hypothetical protein [Brevundimonas sp.]RZJ19603.1 MAG: hypothetical protein EON91_00755 [Brevundimonas sp.]
MRHAASKPSTTPDTTSPETATGAVRPAPRPAETGDAPHASPARQRESLARRLMVENEVQRPSSMKIATRILILLGAIAACAVFWGSAAGIVGELFAR